MKLFQKLDTRGVVHHLALILVILGTAIGGTAYLVASHAAVCVDYQYASGITYTQCVGAIQHMLNAEAPYPNPRLVVDGKFGPLTQTAVKDRQVYWKAHVGATINGKAVLVDGIVGPQTWHMLCFPPAAAIQTAIKSFYTTAGCSAIAPKTSTTTTTTTTTVKPVTTTTTTATTVKPVTTTTTPATVSTGTATKVAATTGTSSTTSSADKLNSTVAQDGAISSSAATAAASANKTSGSSSASKKSAVGSTASNAAKLKAMDKQDSKPAQAPAKKQSFGAKVSTAVKRVLTALNPFHHKAKPAPKTTSTIPKGASL